MPCRIGLLHTGIREEERMITERAKSFDDVSVETIDLRKIVLSPENKNNFDHLDIILQRCASGNKANQALWYFTEIKKPIVNSLESSLLCQNKFATNLRLVEHNIPVPKFAVAFGEKEVTETIDQLGGFPVIIKPVSGTSWGRLMGKLNDQNAVEMILEHKQALGVNHQSFYLQEYINKPQRDIRVYLIGSKVVAAVYRQAEHWITNTARGASLSECPISEEIKAVCSSIHKALGDGLYAIDLFETDKGLLVNEINHTMEFKNVVKKTGADIPGEILSYCQKQTV